MEMLDITLDEYSTYAYSFEETSQTIFKAKSSANIDDDDAMDSWTINQDKKFVHGNDDVI